MKIPIDSVDALGDAVWAVRKARRLRQDDTAGAAGVSHVFVRDVERGKATVQLGRVLQLLSELGIQMHLDLPDGTEQVYLRRRQASAGTLADPQSSPARTAPQKYPKSSDGGEEGQRLEVRESEEEFFRAAFGKDQP